MKKILMLLIISLFISGCTNQQITDEYRFNAFLIQYKNNNNSSLGVLCAVYNDRIYYFSDEMGQSGIYSMKTDGSDIRFEVKAKDIQKLQLRDGKLYYLYYEGISYGKSNERWGNKSYSLKSKDLITDEITEYKDIESKIKGIMEKYQENVYRGLWDFYYLGEDEFIVSYLNPVVPVMNFRLFSNKIKIDGEIPGLCTAERISFGKDIHSMNLRSPSKDNYLLSSGTNDYENIGTYDMAVYDVESDSGFTLRDSVLSDIYMSNIFFRQENNLTIGSKNCIASYDLEKKEINKTCVIDKAEKLMLFDKKYILAKFKNREEIYEFDKEDFSARKVLTNKKGYIIDVKDGGFIVIDKKYLYKKDLSGKELWKVKLEKNYIKDEVKVEIAGDWLFIKSFDLKTEQSSLEEKIDLKNGKKTELEKLIN